MNALIKVIGSFVSSLKSVCAYPVLAAKTGVCRTSHQIVEPMKDHGRAGTNGGLLSESAKYYPRQ